MKQKNILSILISLLTLCSCKEIKTHQEVDKTIVVNSKIQINTKNIDCDYSEKEIGKSSSSISSVELIGLFENLKNTGEHTYGYALMIWKLENEILGFFNIYEGSLEPNRSGPIILGKLENDSLNFKVWTKQNKTFENWQQSDVNIYSFKGVQSESKIIGDFSMFNCSNGEIHQNYAEKVELISSKIWELKNFKNIKEWKEEYSHELNY